MKQVLPKELEPLYSKFVDIFKIDNRHFTEKMKEQLINLGFNVYGDTHPKLKIGNTVITLHSTCSDRNMYRVILRRIRKTLINEYEKGNI